jgi:hypothetical protein
VSSPAQPPGQLEQMQADIAALKAQVAQLQQQEAINTDAILKELANRIAGAPVSQLTGPGSAAGDIDALVGGQPVVEQAVEQIVAQESAQPPQ